jgi:hypothetical protein
MASLNSKIQIQEVDLLFSKAQFKSSIFKAQLWPIGQRLKIKYSKSSNSKYINTPSHPPSFDPSSRVCKNNKPGKGQARHEQQMITSDPARKPREGEMTENGRREYSVKAGKNLVRAELVQEIVRAALEERGKGRK